MTQTDTQPQTQARQTFLSWPAAERHAFCAKWWDQQAAYTLLLDAAGRTREEIADTLGAPAEEIDRTLSPRPPARFTDKLNGSQFPHERKPEVCREFGRLYRDYVDSLVAATLARACERAAWNAEEEGFPGLRPQLEALAAAHNRRAEALRDSRPRMEDPDDDVAVGAVAWGDSRAAFGLEQAGPFICDYAEMLHEVREYRARAKPSAAGQTG